METKDVIIVGGGPAGLSAAVVLGRCRRSVLLFDTGAQRNRVSEGVRNYLTQDGIGPADFIKKARQEARKYGVKLVNKGVEKASRQSGGLFEVTDVDGVVHLARRLLVATGLRDILPDVPGMEQYYGRGVYHCPYCDGWEVRDRPLGVYARRKHGHELALSLRTWSQDVTLFTDGKNYLTPHQSKLLEANGVKLVTSRIEQLAGNGRHLKKVVLRKDGEEVPCHALFFVNGYRQHCDLVGAFGCRVGRTGTVLTNRAQQTQVEGLYVAGDVARDVHFVVVAAAEGAKAGVYINKDLQQVDLVQVGAGKSTPEKRAS